MRWSRWSLVGALAALAATAAAATAAAGGGGPSPGVAVGGDGVRAASDDVRYVAVGGRGATVVTAIRVRGGRVVRHTVLAGNLGIPLVAFDGTRGGLAADGRTLVLATYAGAAPSTSATELAVIRTRNLRESRRVRLPGLWAFDAISPDGATIFAVEYLSPETPDRYQVRAIDARSGRLLPGVIVDKRNAGEEMRGLPLTRATDREGRWAYTLYAKSDGMGFIHALDTVNRAAVCIDLPWRAQDAFWSMRMSMAEDGRTLTLRQRGLGRLAVVDLQRFTVRALRAPVAR